jgi:hypothetical protein
MEVRIRPKDDEIEIGGVGPQGFTVGRNTCRLAFAVGGEGVTLCVSKQHCLLRIVDGKLWLQDLSSTNGTFICTQVPTTGFDVEAALRGAPTPLGATIPESGIVRVQVESELPEMLFVRRVTGPKGFNPGTEVQIDPAVHSLLLVGPQEAEGWVIGRFFPEGKAGNYRLRLFSCTLVVPVDDDEEEEAQTLVPGEDD